MYLVQSVFFASPSHLLKIIHRVRGHTLHLVEKKRTETITNQTTLLQKRMENVENMKKMGWFWKVEIFVSRKQNMEG